MTDIENTSQPPHTITELKDALSKTLLTEGHDPVLLSHQAVILDRLFTAIVDQKVAGAFDSRYPESTQKWLDFALRVQKQCTASIKARAAIDYMNGLNNRPPVALPVKRTEEN